MLFYHDALKLFCVYFRQRRKREDSVYDQFGRPEHDVLSSKENREDPVGAAKSTAVENPVYTCTIDGESGVSEM